MWPCFHQAKSTPRLGALPARRRLPGRYNSVWNLYSEKERL